MLKLSLSIAIEGRPSARVSYAELNLNGPSGIAVLNGRVHRAAETLCLDSRVRDLGRASAGTACVAEALASARPQIERAIASAASNTHLAAATRTIILSLAR
jgi:UrcA family protein